MALRDTKKGAEVLYAIKKFYSTEIENMQATPYLWIGYDYSPRIKDSMHVCGSKSYEGCRPLKKTRGENVFVMRLGASANERFPGSLNGLDWSHKNGVMPPHIEVWLERQSNQTRLNAEAFYEFETDLFKDYPLHWALVEKQTVRKICQQLDDCEWYALENGWDHAYIERIGGIQTLATYIQHYQTPEEAEKVIKLEMDQFKGKAWADDDDSEEESGWNLSDDE